MMRVLTVFWRMFRAYAFYPAAIGLFIWLYVKGAHWVWGALLVGVILYLDRLWLIILRNLWNKRR